MDMDPNPTDFTHNQPNKSGSKSVQFVKIRPLNQTVRITLVINQQIEDLFW